MKNVVIITDGHFPEGDAGAVRLLYVAKAMTAVGCKVTVLCRGRLGNGIIDEIEYISFRERKANFLAKVIAYLHFSRNVAKFLKKQNELSCVYIYNAPLAVFHWCKKKYAKTETKLVYDCVEWYSPEQFKHGKYSYSYWIKNHTVTHVVDQSFSVIAISRFLERHFSGKGIRTLRVPILCDTGEYNGRKKVEDTLNLFYAGSPQKKDLIGNVLDAMLLLDLDERKKIKITFVGTTKEHLVAKCGISLETLDRCSDVLNLYGRKPRGEVLDMMQNADFTLLFRDPDLRYAKAGFPSKIVESLANATPVFCNCSSDLELYLKDNENAIIAKDHSPEAIVEAIRRAAKLSVENKLCMSKEALESAKKYFDYQLYQNALSEFLCNYDI